MYLYKMRKSLEIRTNYYWLHLYGIDIFFNLLNPISLIILRDIEGRERL